MRGRPLWRQARKAGEGRGSSEQDRPITEPGAGGFGQRLPDGWHDPGSVKNQIRGLVQDRTGG
ncbi:hypothetical protein ACFXCZ_14890 [Streptomyces sp. NPDC059396]|uniref:hypothetical protein n=1 Tax=Streptomyces sp. NPDC059396 TaxID=3346819 RepID=UPI0036B2F042